MIREGGFVQKGVELLSWKSLDYVLLTELGDRPLVMS